MGLPRVSLGRQAVPVLGRVFRSVSSAPGQNVHAQEPSYHPIEFATAPIGLAPANAGGIGVDLQPWIALAGGLIEDLGDALLRRVEAWRTRARMRGARISQSLGGYAKRMADIAIASTALVLLSPVLLVVAGLVRWRLGGPVIFPHTRVGFGGRPFECLKFRSMVNNGDEVLARHLSEKPAALREWEETRKLRDDPRITPLGRILRKTSIDELPQLWNILCGDMSIVGPRPIVTAELALYGVHARHYLNTRPGLTGVWQISGRSSTSYRDRVIKDTYYVRNWSLWLDAKIIIMTVPAVIKTGDAV